MEVEATAHCGDFYRAEEVPLEQAIQAAVLVRHLPPSTVAADQQATHAARQPVLYCRGGPLVQRCQLPLQPSLPVRQIVLEQQRNIPAGNAAPWPGYS